MKYLLMSLILLCGCTHREDKYDPGYNSNGITVIVIHSDGRYEVFPTVKR